MLEVFTDAGLEQEGWAPFDGAVTPGGKAVTREGKLAVGKGAIGEIKPHKASGIRRGLAQLHARRFGTAHIKPTHPDAPQWLITYLPVNDKGLPVRSGRASAVRVFARSVSWPGRNRKADCGPLYDLGRKGLDATISYPAVNEPGFFGFAVERDIRAHLYRRTDRPAVRGAGGGKPGPDLLWNEIAALYSELSRLTGDRLFAEIAAELQSVTG
jgi:hypothetical protein